MRIDHVQGARIRNLRGEVLFAVYVADEVFSVHGVEAIITSGTDGKHSRGSLHYSGGAVDLRSRDFQPGDAVKAVKELKSRLGPDFDIILERNHIHMEYQPHEE